MNIWQVGSGDTGRDYSDLFLMYDVMLIGPGHKGPFSEEVYRGERMRSQIKAFVQQPQAGDLVLLRNGQVVVAVGRIPSGDEHGYEWNPAFDDVLGWSLQHSRRVIWSTDAAGILEPQQPVFGNLTQQRTFTRVREGRLTELHSELDACIRDRDLKLLPDIPEPLEDDELGIDLFEAGLANDSVEKVLDSIERIRRLAQWYRTAKSGSRPSEIEAVAHMIIPLMSGLGWSEQLMGVEWKNIDLALFERTPTDEQHCVLVLEAKRPGKGLDSAYRQAVSYVEGRNLQRCRKIVATDGQRLLVYERNQDSGWQDKPTGYIHLGKIRRRNLFPFDVSAIETLISLMPAAIHR